LSWKKLCRKSAKISPPDFTLCSKIKQLKFPVDAINFTWRIKTMKLLCLDKDGTLVVPTDGDKFVQKPWGQSPLVNASIALNQYVADGWLPVIISNQGGVASGYKSLEDTIQEMRYCMELFPQIQEAYFAPGYEGDSCWRVWGNCDREHRIEYTVDYLENEVFSISDHEIPEHCDYRKPGCGMLALAACNHCAEQIMMVGDRNEDEQAMRNFLQLPQSLKMVKSPIANQPNFLWDYQWRGEDAPIE
jgi:D-glycero-D-manno-heptose 1,7-bisphosphate phosphatase